LVSKSILVEGAGGLLVALDEEHHTLADVAAALSYSAAAVVVCRSGLGTLNHTELTLEALRRQITISGTIIGSWPHEPTYIEISNRHYLCAHATPLIATIPQDVTRLAPAEFRTSAISWFNVLRARPISPPTSA